MQRGRGNSRGGYNQSTNQQIQQLQEQINNLRQQAENVYLKSQKPTQSPKQATKQQRQYYIPYKPGHSYMSSDHQKINLNFLGISAEISLASETTADNVGGFNSIYSEDLYDLNTKLLVRFPQCVLKKVQYVMKYLETGICPTGFTKKFTMTLTYLRKGKRITNNFKGRIGKNNDIFTGPSYTLQQNDEYKEFLNTFEAEFCFHD